MGEMRFEYGSSQSSVQSLECLGSGQAIPFGWHGSKLKRRPCSVEPSFFVVGDWHVVQLKLYIGGIVSRWLPVRVPGTPSFAPKRLPSQSLRSQQLHPH